MHVVELWYEQLVPFAVSFAGFMPGCDALPFPPSLGEADVELDDELVDDELVAACFC